MRGPRSARALRQVQDKRDLFPFKLRRTTLDLVPILLGHEWRSGDGEAGKVSLRCRVFRILRGGELARALPLRKLPPQHLVPVHYMVRCSQRGLFLYRKDKSMLRLPVRAACFAAIAELRSPSSMTSFR